MANTKLTIGKKKSLAQIMYLTGKYTQKAIASEVDVAEKTLSKWVNEGKWDNLKTDLVASNTEMLGQLQKLLQKKIEEGEIALADDDPNTNPDEDGIIKLAKSIHYLQTKTNTGQMYETGMEFLSWLQKVNVELAKQVAPLFLKFIK